MKGVPVTKKWLNLILLIILFAILYQPQPIIASTSSGNLDQVEISQVQLVSTSGKEESHNPIDAYAHSRVPFCYDIIDVPIIECEALLALYESTNGTSWTDNTNWLDQNTVGNWYGVTVSDGHITYLQLDDNNLNGEIPLELGELEYLNGLFLHTNNLTGQSHLLLVISIILSTFNFIPIS